MIGLIGPIDTIDLIDGFATGHSLEPSVTSLRRILRNPEKYGTSVECGVKRASLSMSTSVWMTVWK